MNRHEKDNIDTEFFLYNNYKHVLLNPEIQRKQFQIKHNKR